jgi:hypothetical protein
LRQSALHLLMLTFIDLKYPAKVRHSKVRRSKINSPKVDNSKQEGRQT